MQHFQDIWCFWYFENDDMMLMGMILESKC